MAKIISLPEYRAQIKIDPNRTAAAIIQAAAIDRAIFEPKLVRLTQRRKRK